MVEVPRAFREMPRWWHDQDGRRWLDELPARAAAACRRWRLEPVGPPWHGSNALVLPVRRGAAPLALRLSPPGDDVEVLVAALAAWRGAPVVRLVEADPPAGAVLLERLEGGRSLADEPLEVALPVLAGLVRALAVPVADTVTTTRDLAAASAAGFERDWRARGEPCPVAVLRTAVAHAEALAAGPAGSLAVDGDLHGEQVLRGRRFPWVVVDPVLLRGDPEFDLGRVLWSRLDELPTPAEVRAAFHLFVAAAGVPADRARSWVVVRAMDYLLWGLAHGLTEDPPRCRRLLAVFGGGAGTC